MKKLEEVEMMFLVKGCKRSVQIINAWEQYGHLYIQMELCVNGTLENYVDEATRILPMEEYQIGNILAELALVRCFTLNVCTSCDSRHSRITFPPHKLITAKRD